MDSPEDRRRRWAAGIPYERRFWAEWIRTRGKEWPDDFATRMDPQAPLKPFPAHAAQALGRPALRLLDVGAGPITWIGYRLPGVALDIAAVDPLAPLYAALLAAQGLVPPVPTRLATAEELALFCPEGGFDLVHCRNALDHAVDPLLGLRQMLAATRVGGMVLLEHFRNEGEHGAYSGFHQWNFDLQDGRFVIWNRSGTIDVANALGCGCRLEAEMPGHVLVTITRTGDCPPPPLPPDLTAAGLEAEIRALIDTAPPWSATARSRPGRRPRPHSRGWMR